MISYWAKSDGYTSEHITYTPREPRGYFTIPGDVRFKFAIRHSLILGIWYSALWMIPFVSTLLGLRCPCQQHCFLTIHTECSECIDGALRSTEWMSLGKVRSCSFLNYFFVFFIFKQHVLGLWNETALAPPVLPCNNPLQQADALTVPTSARFKRAEEFFLFLSLVSVFLHVCLSVRIFTAFDSEYWVYQCPRVLPVHVLRFERCHNFTRLCVQ